MLSTYLSSLYQEAVSSYGNRGANEVNRRSIARARPVRVTQVPGEEGRIGNSVLTECISAVDMCRHLVAREVTQSYHESLPHSELATISR